MLWYCRFAWHEGTTTEKVRQRVLRQHAAGTNHPERIRGWYNLAGGGAGFLLIEAEDPRELNPILEPYLDLVNWDVHAVYELPYEEVTMHLRERAAGNAAQPDAADERLAMERMTAEGGIAGPPLSAAIGARFGQQSRSGAD